MTDFTTAQLATILSALAGKPRKPTTKAGSHAGDRPPGCCHRPHQGGGARLRARAARGLARSRRLARPADRSGRACGLRQARRAGGRRRLAATGAGRVTFRPGTKQALIAGLLRREQGATLDELIAATGWLPHTTRAALTGLRRKGCTLEKSSRARTARPPTGSCRPTRRRPAMLPRARRPEAMPLDPKRAAAAEVEIAQLRGSRPQSPAGPLAQPARPAGTKPPAQASAAAAPRLPAAGSRPWRPRSRHATLPRSGRPSGRLRHR